MKLYATLIFPCILLAGCNPAEDVWADAVIVQGKQEISQRFRDPSTAVFRDVYYNSGRWVPVACGEVDAEKFEGGRTGFQRFIATREKYTVLESDQFPHEILPESVASFDAAWEWACH
jgi:hypothetical protein